MTGGQKCSSKGDRKSGQRERRELWRAGPREERKTEKSATVPSKK